MSANLKVRDDIDDLCSSIPIINYLYAQEGILHLLDLFAGFMYRGCVLSISKPAAYI